MLQDVLSNANSNKLGYRTPPHNYEAEQALLGAILVNNKAMERVSEFLEAIHFFDPVHGRIFEACVKLIERGQIANPVTLKAYFEQDNDLDAVGGASYLADLASNVVSIVNSKDYGQQIHELYIRRKLIDLGEIVVNEAYTHDIDISAMDQISQAEAKLFNLATAGDVRGGFVSFDKSLKQALETTERAFQTTDAITGVTTGMRDIDAKMGGLQPSDLIILAGRPSMGKTTLATNMAFNAAKAYMQSDGSDGGVVAFFSLEMSAEQLASRILAEQSRVPSDKMRRGEISDEEFARVVEAANFINRAPFFIDDTPGISISAMRTRCRRLKRTSGLDMVVVDYLQLMRGSSTSSQENRVQEIGEISRGLKEIAKELHVPVLALSQLSRAVEQREDKRPQMSDLRESGSIEQDADVVLFVFREPYYLERSEPQRRDNEGDEKFNLRHQQWKQRCEEVHGTAEVIFAKQRHGPIGTVRLAFEGQFTKFSDLDHHHSGSDQFEE